MIHQRQVVKCPSSDVSAGADADGRSNAQNCSFQKRAFLHNSKGRIVAVIGLEDQGVLRITVIRMPTMKLVLSTS